MSNPVAITYINYIDDILSGEKPACNLVKLAVERHAKDLRRLPALGYYFDEQAAERGIKFHHLLPHVKGEWARRRELIVWEPWQQFILAQLYGWKCADGTNRFTECYIEVPRKNAKSTMAAGIGLKALVMDEEEGAEVYVAANKKDQAKIVWSIARRMVEKSWYLNEVITIRTNTLSIRATDSVMAPLGRDSTTTDGLNPSDATVDEYHEAKTDELYNVINDGMIARDNPRITVITTAGFNQEGPCFRMRKGIKDILEGKAKNENTFGIIWTVDDPEKWDDPKQWEIANPNFGISVKLKKFRQNYKTAITEGGSKIVNFKTKHLNIWTGSGDEWVPDHKIKKCYYDDFDIKKLHGQRCHAGLDLASVSDFTVFGLDFMYEGIDRMMNFYFLPEDTFTEKYKNFLHWRDFDRLILTPGNTVDYGAIRRLLTGYRLAGDKIVHDADCLMKKYDIQLIGYDDWNSSQIITDLQDIDGVKKNKNNIDILAPFRQGYKSLSPPTKEIEKLALECKLDFLGDPIIRWMFGNVVISRDPADNQKPDKSKSMNKIDGVISLVMAKGEQLGQPKQQKSIWETDAIT